MTRSSLVVLILLGLALCAAQETPDELRVKRAPTFEFAQKPSIARSGDRVTVSFAVQAACDVTVAVEDEKGRIVRHLACGVLGERAPEPFQQGSLTQAIVWDGKDDAGKYVDALETHRIRVSLGLKPAYEKDLFWHPAKRASSETPLLAACEEGVLVCDGGLSIDHVRLFDHDGKYKRTIYPFPAAKVAQVKGLAFHRHLQEGETLPVKTNFLQNTFFDCGTNGPQIMYQDGRYDSVVGKSAEHYGMYGRAATALAAGSGRVALANWRLNRFGLDGSSAGLNLRGPEVASKTNLKTIHNFKAGAYEVGPTSAALSPDGTWLYLSGYHWNWHWHQDGFHGVTRVKMDGDGKPEVFAGSMKQNDSGAKDGQFAYALGVDVDAKSRVYVADHMNGRVQVFGESGKHLKNIPVAHPVTVRVHRRNGEIYVFSWAMGNNAMADRVEEAKKKNKPLVVAPKLTRFASFEDPKKLADYDVPLNGATQPIRSSYGWCNIGWQWRAELDSWAEPPAVWIVPGTPGHQYNLAPGQKASEGEAYGSDLRVYRVGKDALELKVDFGRHIKESVVRGRSAVYNRQRIYANPVTGNLYLAEGEHTANGKAFSQLVEIDPASGKVGLLGLPMHAEDLCFDRSGYLYLRTAGVIARFERKGSGWTEVPFDYGQEMPRVGFGSMSGTIYKDLIGAINIPTSTDWHQGGFGISVKGHLVVGVLYGKEVETRTGTEKVSESAEYQPTMYPGRQYTKKGTIVHVFDYKGKKLHEDALPGLPDCYGVEIDRDDGLYVLSSATRMYGDKRYYNDLSGTLLKARPGKARIVTGGAKVPLPAGNLPDRPADFVGAIQGGKAWAEGTEWLYGGVGYGGKNRGVGCACHNARFHLDYFARSFVPEVDRYRVAVLDANGNLILRIGQYGNVDDRPGEDQVALFHGAYLASQTDRRLFVADPGNARIVSVRLDYHANETLPVPAETASAP